MKEEKQLLDLTLDAAFKLFFKGHDGLLKSLLRNFLPLPPNSLIEKVELKDSEVKSGEGTEEKTFVMDMKVYFVERKETGKSVPKMVDVEMQTTEQGDFADRILLYNARLASEHINAGKKYHEATPVYSLIFTTVNLRELKQLKKKFYHEFVMRRRGVLNVVLSSKIQIIIVELGKFDKGMNKLLDRRDAWCYLLKRSKDMNKKSCSELAKKGEDMGDAVKRLQDLSEDESTKRYLEAVEKQRKDHFAQLKYKWDEGLNKGRKEGIEKGIEKGMEKGRETEKTEIALKMLRSGFSLHDISACTDLSLDKLEKLRKEGW